MDDSQLSSASDAPITTQTRARSAAPGAPRTSEAAKVFGWGATDDTWDAEETLLSWKLIGAILGVLLIVGFGTYRVFGGGGGKTETAAKPPAAVTPGETVPGPAATEAAITDSFAGEDATGLGTTDTGQVWETPSGIWGKTAGHAYLVEANKEGGNRSVALVDLKSGNGSVSVSVAKMVPNWGLVFRYKGPFNYWMLVASPKFGTYNLVEVEDGKTTTAGKTGLAKQDVGTVVSVTFQSEQITVLVDGAEVASATDASPSGATKVGLVAADATAKDAQWSEFTATKLPAKGAGGATTTTPAGVGP